MKKAIVTFYLLAFVAFNLFSQVNDHNPSFKADSGYIIVDGGKLFYEITGNGENIVLLHDGMVHREIWDAQCPGNSSHARRQLGGCSH